VAGCGTWVNPPPAGGGGAALSDAPHCWQNVAPAGFSVEQAGHCISISSSEVLLRRAVPTPEGP
jgi:hypothetical protein